MPRVNSCPNPSCANNLDGWGTSGSGTRLTGLVGPPRSTGITVTFPGGPYSEYIGSQILPAAAGQTWSGVIWVRASAARNIQVGLSGFVGSGYVNATGSRTVSVAANTWTQVQVTGTLSGSIDGVNLSVDGPAGWGAGDVLSASACRMEQVSDAAITYADGDTSGWVWDGAPGNSTSTESAAGATAITVDDARAAARATSPLLVLHEAPALAVHDARAVTRATRPVLVLHTPLAPPVLRERPGRWQFILGPAQGGWKWRLANGKSRKASFKLRDPSAASFTIRGGDPLATHIDELATDLHLLRRNRAGVVEQLYRGRVIGASDELSESGHVVTVPTVDYRSVLTRRILSSGSQVEWLGYDQLYVLNGLLIQAQNKPGGDYGISYITTPSGVVVDRTFKLGDSIGQKMQQESETGNGFDWDIVPDGPSALHLRGWPQRGTARGVILQYGGAAVASIKRAVDSGEYANMVRVEGQPPEGQTGPGPIYEGVAAGIDDPLLFPQGRWDKTFGVDLTMAAAVSDRKDWLLDYHQVIRPSYTIKLAADFWDGPSHIWLGDPIRLVIASGRLLVDTTLRVLEIEVEISDEGEETVSLTVGAPRPDFRRWADAASKRIDQLERR